MAEPRLWKIELVVETDDVAELNRIVDDCSRAACPIQGPVEHRCEVPWILVTSELVGEQAATWRDDLSRGVVVQQYVAGSDDDDPASA